MLLERNKCAVTLSIVYCERLHHLMQIHVAFLVHLRFIAKQVVALWNAYKPCFLLRFIVKYRPEKKETLNGLKHFI